MHLAQDDKLDREEIGAALEQGEGLLKEAKSFDTASFALVALRRIWRD